MSVGRVIVAGPEGAGAVVELFVWLLLLVLLPLLALLVLVLLVVLVVVFGVSAGARLTKVAVLKRLSTK